MASIRVHLLHLLALAVSIPPASASGLRSRTTQRHDFNLTAKAIPSGLVLSSTNPPPEPVPFKDIGTISPEIIIAGLNASDPAALYSSFVGVEQEDMYVLPKQGQNFWIVSWKVNQTMLEDGTLEGGQEEIFSPYFDQPMPVFQTGEVRNASVNVWLQTEQFMNLMYTKRNGIGRPPWFDMLGLWRRDLNYGTLISFDFPQSSINFTIHKNTASNGTDTNDDTNNAVLQSPHAFEWLALFASGALLAQLG